QSVPSVALGMGVIRPAPDCNRTVPCRTTNASPFLNAATATVFGSGWGVATCSSETATPGSASDKQRTHTTARESHMNGPPIRKLACGDASAADASLRVRGLVLERSAPLFLQKRKPTFSIGKAKNNRKRRARFCAPAALLPPVS